MKNKKLFWQIPFLAFLIIGTVLIIRQQQNMPYQQNRGVIFGTNYSITYQHEKDLQKEIDEALMKVDSALSMFNKQSVISRINQGNGKFVIPNNETGKMFVDVFNLAMRIAEETNGAFDKNRLTVSESLCHTNRLHFGKSTANKALTKTIHVSCLTVLP